METSDGLDTLTCSFFMSANAKQLEHPAFQVGLIGRKIRREYHF